MTSRQLWIDYLRYGDDASYDAVCSIVIPLIVRTLAGLPDKEVETIIGETFEILEDQPELTEPFGDEVEGAFITMAHSLAMAAA